MAALFQLNHVTKTYAVDPAHAVTAARELNLIIQRGEFVVITGRSGSGKTTLLNLMTGLVRPTQGRVELDGVDLWSLPDRQQSAIRNCRIGFVFQFPSLLPSLTALENVLLPASLGPGTGHGAVMQRAVRLIERVGLQDKLSAFPRQLSAGQQQRVVIARALVNEPEILIADEPTSNLDEQTEKEILATLEAVHALQGVTVAMVTHASYLGAHGARFIEMADGRIVKETRH